MAFCPSCGANVPSSDNFCASCGHAIAQGNQAEAPPPVAPPPASVPETPTYEPAPPRPAYAPAVTSLDQRATFLQRLAALILDNILVWVAYFVTIIPLTVSTDSEAIPPAAVVWFILVWAVLVGTFLYGWRKGWSPGKLVVGIRFIKTGGELPGLGTALLREIIGKFISGIVFYLGYLWVLWDPERQAWHDKIAGTYVVKIR